MNRVGRWTFFAGSVTFLVIGLLHTFTQLTDLSAEGVAAAFRSIGTVSAAGQDPEAWDLFQGLSYLMGFFAIALGASDLALMKALGPDALPPAGVCVVNVAMLASITAVGVLFLGPIQAFGGPVGIVMFGIPIVAQLRNASS